MKTTQKIFILSILILFTGNLVMSALASPSTEGAGSQDENDPLPDQDFQYYREMLLEENDADMDFYNSMTDEQKAEFDGFVELYMRQANGEEIEIENHTCNIAVDVLSQTDASVHIRVRVWGSGWHWIFDWGKIWVYRNGAQVAYRSHNGDLWWGTWQQDFYFSGDNPGDYYSLRVNAKCKGFGSETKDKWFGNYKVKDDDDKKPEITTSPSSSTTRTDANPGKITWSVTDNIGLSNVDVYPIVNGIQGAKISDSASGTYSIPKALGTYQLKIYAMDNDNDRPGDALSETRLSGIVTIIDDDSDAPELKVYDGTNEWETTDVKTFEDNIAFVSVTAEAPDYSGLAPNGLYLTSSDSDYYATVINDEGIYTKISSPITIDSLNYYSGDGNGGSGDDAWFVWVKTIGGVTFESKLQDYCSAFWGHEANEYFRAESVFATYEIPELEGSDVGYPLSPQQENDWMTYTTTITVDFDVQAFDWYQNWLGTHGDSEGPNDLNIYYRKNSGSMIQLHYEDGNGDDKDWHHRSYTISGVAPGDDIQFIAIHDGIVSPASYIWFPVNDFKEARVSNIRVSMAYDWEIISDYSVFTFPMENDLGVHSFDVTAIDNDLDRGSIDQSSITNSYWYEVEDDDDTGPTIEITYIGDGTDNDPGYLLVDAYDESGLFLDPSGKYYLEDIMDDGDILGSYEFTFTAIDNDNDRIGDKESTTNVFTVIINDDDTDAPEILATIMNEDTDGKISNYEDYLSLELNITDEISGIASVELIYNSESFYPTLNEENGKWYIDLPLIYELGPQSFVIMAIDNDNDENRPLGDGTMAIETFSFYIKDDVIYDMTLIIESLDFSLGDNNIIATYDLTLSPELSYRGQRYTDLMTGSATTILYGTGIYTISGNVWNDIFDSVEVTSAFEFSDDDFKELVLEELSELKLMVANAPDECWRNPEENRRNTMLGKIDEVISLVEDDSISEAYEKLMHDIKPKLTGLKEDESGNIFGNGIFKNPWIKCQEGQAEFEQKINGVLWGLNNI